MRRTATALLFSTALFCAPALAQTTQGQSSTPAQPQASAPAATAQPAGSKFVTDQQMGEFRVSKFMGVDIYGSDNEKIGDIKEILVDGQGDAKAIVIGVGGFLGIGEKNVAVPWSSVTWVNERPQARTAATTGGPAGPATTGAGTTAGGTPGAGNTGGGATTTGAGNTAGTPAGGGTATTGTPATRGPATTGTATTGGPAGAGATRSPAEQATMNGAPDHGRVQLTRAELNDAPTFRWYGDDRSRDTQKSNTPQRQ